MGDHPLISVIVPVYNDPEGIRATLSSLTEQRASVDFEVLVVDNDSTDKTPSTIDEFVSKHPDLITGLKETNIQSSYAARNTGIAEANGDIIAFLDADETVEQGWISDLENWFTESDVEYLGCNVEMYIPEAQNTFWAKYDLAMGLPVEHYLKSKRFVPTCALVVRKEVFEQIDAFDETLVSGGDREFGHRVHNANFEVDYAEHVVVRHPARTTLQSHIKKAARIGTGQAQLWESNGFRPHPLSPTRVLPPSPTRVKKRMGREGSFFTIYVFDYFLKLIQTYFAIKELISDRLHNSKHS